MYGSTQELDDFRCRYTPGPPRSFSGPREMVRLQEKDGLRFLQFAPATGVSTGTPPRSLKDRSTNRYLWVIDKDGIPYIIESRVPVIDSKPKHTNLTGGGDAYLGGEVWFKSFSSLYVSGGSGRYPPRDVRQLEKAGQVFESFGYAVIPLGWDYGTGRAKRYLEELQ